MFICWAAALWAARQSPADTGQSVPQTLLWMLAASALLGIPHLWLWQKNRPASGLGATTLRLIHLLISLLLPLGGLHLITRESFHLSQAANSSADSLEKPWRARLSVSIAGAASSPPQATPATSYPHESLQPLQVLGQADSMARLRILAFYPKSILAPAKSYQLGKNKRPIYGLEADSGEAHAQQLALFESPHYATGPDAGPGILIEVLSPSMRPQARVLLHALTAPSAELNLDGKTLQLSLQREIHPPGFSWQWLPAGIDRSQAQLVCSDRNSSPKLIRPRQAARHHAYHFCLTRVSADDRAEMRVEYAPFLFPLHLICILLSLAIITHLILTLLERRKNA
jgi:hypothetical protein